MMIGMVTQIQFIGILEIMKGSGGHLEKKKLKKYASPQKLSAGRKMKSKNLTAPTIPRLEKTMHREKITCSYQKTFSFHGMTAWQDVEAIFWFLEAQLLEKPPASYCRT